MFCSVSFGLFASIFRSVGVYECICSSINSNKCNELINEREKCASKRSAVGPRADERDCG